MFWKTGIPLFSNKSMVSNKIVLIEGNKLINNDPGCVKLFNNFFNDIIKESKISVDIDPSPVEHVSMIDDLILAAV